MVVITLPTHCLCAIVLKVLPLGSNPVSLCWVSNFIISLPYTYPSIQSPLLYIHCLGMCDCAHLLSHLPHQLFKHTNQATASFVASSTNEAVDSITVAFKVWLLSLILPPPYLPVHCFSTPISHTSAHRKGACFTVHLSAPWSHPIYPNSCTYHLHTLPEGKIASFFHCVLYQSPLLLWIKPRSSIPLPSPFLRCM